MAQTGLPVASLPDRMRLLAEVVAPLLAKGPLLRRPRAEVLAERLGLDGHAVRVLARMRDRYGEGPLLLSLPGRLHALALSPDVALRILRGTPDPFSPATLEKRRALSHWEPETSLASRGASRGPRRAFSDAALELGCPVHSRAGHLLPVVAEEAERMVARARGRLGWWEFVEGWDAMMRRLLFGRAAREDHDLMDLLRRLRRRANLVVAPRRGDLIAELHRRIAGHMARAEPGSLAAGLPTGGSSAPTHQVAQWLFALNTSGMAVYRALALLAAHPWVLEKARDEVREAKDAPMLPLLRASIFESIRLWPTTPAILREAIRDVDWDGAVIPKGTSLIVHAPFLHRDPGLSFADRFAPELWLDEGGGVRLAFEGPMALVPFSAGPGLCPAANLLPMIGAAWLAHVIRRTDPKIEEPERIDPDRGMPGELNPFSVRFRLRPR
jgi:hypothetical protein